MVCIQTCSIDDNNWNILHFGACLNNVEYINLGMEYANKILRFANARRVRNFRRYRFLNQTDLFQNIPMHIAVIESSYQVIEALLQFRDDSHNRDTNTVLRKQVTAKNSDGWIPLALAIISNDFKCFDILAKPTAQILDSAHPNRIFFTNNRYFQGFTALTLAITS